MKNIPIDSNMRSSHMWDTIAKRVDFRHKTVIDLGCGTGDFLWRARVAGADQVVGVDKHTKIMELPQTYDRMNKPNVRGFNAIGVLPWDLNDYSTLADNSFYDIAMCFSVLPYLDDMAGFLVWMANSFPLCLIEAQYRPEPYNVGKSNDAEMGQFLIDCGFNEPDNIGATHVGIRDAWRTIWLCNR